MPVHSVLWGQMTASYCEPGPLATVCTPLALWGPQEAPHRPTIHLLQGPSPRENRSLLLPRATLAPVAWTPVPSLPGKWLGSLSTC